MGAAADELASTGGRTGCDLDEGAGLLDGEHGGLELLLIGVAAGEALHSGGGSQSCWCMVGSP